MDSTATPSRPIKGLALIAPFFLWGTAMVAMKGIITTTTPLFLASLRLMPAGVLVLLAASWMGRPQPKSWQAWGWVLGFAVIDGCLFQGCLAQGLVHTGAGLGSVMIDSQPLAVALLARWLFAERIGLLGWLGLTIGLLGISLLGLPDEWIWTWLGGRFPTLDGAIGQLSVQAFLTHGEWLMLLAALSMAVGTVMVPYVARHADPVVATGWHMVLGGLPLLAWSVFSETDQWQYLDWSGWMAILYSTVFGSALAYGLFFYLAAQGNLTSLSALTFLTPVFALLFSNLFLAEVLSWLQWTGVSLTLVSIYLINQRETLLQWIRQWLEPPIEPLAEPVSLDSDPSETSSLKSGR
ncbi:putative transporter [Halomicronema hongdechloris C2206]|uniref:Transporter n=1 Tax=Halomicronema hongdechloris C2206 TaxID=1641165 RepID=A0A1Z3HP46_9CYAN|nr:DMT family transporter [Halomicronema hongdechloris]ASC72068.1 putative transporter [Halomicronema hongdechloris C2206]